MNLLLAGMVPGSFLELKRGEGELSLVAGSGSPGWGQAVVRLDPGAGEALRSVLGAWLGASLAWEWRVSWTMWPHRWPEQRRSERLYDLEADAQHHLAGLRSLEADHELRPCDRHIWGPALERRRVERAAWEPA